MVDVEKVTMIQACQNKKTALLAQSSLPLRVAVVLNGNARAVNEKLIRKVKQIVPKDSLYISRSLEQAKFIARHIVNKRYQVVLCGGGDGTFSQCVTDVMALHPTELPAFGVLRLGTGNALASVLGASSSNLRGMASDLDQARIPGSQTELPLLRVEQRVAPFAGLGLDSMILSDYNQTKRRLEGTPLSALGKGGAGYAIAVASRSFWRYLLQPLPQVTIRNEGAIAYRMDLEGSPIGSPIPRGGVLYKGPVGLAAASTIPCYGFGLKLFPQAMKRRDRFQLRVASLDLLSMVANLPGLYVGKHSDSRIYDYFCTAISIAVTSATPFQIGGDEVGKRQGVHIGLTHVKATLGRKAIKTEQEKPSFARAS
jgi:diacylglycerol kinase family enzyme